MDQQSKEEIREILKNLGTQHLLNEGVDSIVDIFTRQEYRLARAKSERIKFEELIHEQKD